MSTLRRVISRGALRGVITGAVIALTFASGCIRKVSVPETLVSSAPAAVEELVNRVNAYSSISSFSAQADIYVFDYVTGEQGTANRFPGASSAIRFERPEKIRVLVTAPIVSSDIADMTSDGQQFKLAIYWPRDDRVFVRGSNWNEVHHVECGGQIKQAADPRLKQAGALANIRPQHITDAFIIKPIPLNGQVEYFKEEDREIEPDPRPRKKGRMVERTYDVLCVLERGDNGRSFLRRKFWFDRSTRGSPLVRQQTFEDGDGRIGSDVTYEDFFQIHDTNWTWARSIKIRRPNDCYDIWLILDPDRIAVNLDLPATTFVLENTQHMKELDLDHPGEDTRAQASRAGQNRK